MDRDREAGSRQTADPTVFIRAQHKAGGKVFVPPKYPEQRMGTNIHLSSKSLALQSAGRWEEPI